MEKIRKINIVAITIMIIQITYAITPTKAAFFEDLTKWLNLTTKVMAEGDEVHSIFTTGIDISKNGDGSVIAKLSEDQTTLTITGNGKMKIFRSGISPWYSYRTNITTVNIEKGVTSIGDYAFWGCSSLSNITIPSSVTSIGSDAFYNCSNLSSITIPSNVTSIGNSAFCGCSSLSSITIPEGVTNIEGHTFEDCSNLSSITIPEGVTSIGDYAFSGCSSLSNITIPSSVTSIGSSAFSNCSNLSNITIPSSVTSIGSDAFYNCSNLSSITIPEGVTSIGDYAFSGCSSLSSITIPEGVTNIEGHTFEDCSNLSSITIPEGVTSIGDYAFSGCSSLSNITIPSSVTSIGSGAFMGCISFSNIRVDSNNGKYLSEDGVLYNKEKTLIIQYPSKKDGSYYIIPEGVTSIGDYAFSGCNSLSNIIIPNSVTSIGKYVFNNCSNLSSITIPSNVTSVRSGAFWGCSSLSSITIPEGVTSIGNYAFEGCSNLSSITLPSSVTSIGEYAFHSCRNLTNIEIPNNVTSIGERAFIHCRNLTIITIPNSVTKIGEGAFFTDSIGLGAEDSKGLTIICKSNSEAENYAKKYEVNYITDDIAPTMTVSPESAAVGKSTNVTITVTDNEGGAGLSSSNSYQYYLSTSSTELSGGSWINYTNGVSFTAGTGLTGTYYLFIKSVYDKVGNTSISNGTATTISNVTYQRYGSYVFDNTGPTITVSPESAIACKSTNVTITVVDNEGGAGLSSSNSYQYYLSTSSTELSGGSWTNYTSGTAFTIGSGITGIRYLFVKRVNDKVGNTSISNGTTQEIGGTTYQRYGSYVFDNTSLTVESTTYKIENYTIGQIQPKTTVEELKNNIKTNATTITVTDKDGKVVSEKTQVGTGMKIVFNESNTYTIVVSGDTNGDGKADIKDILKINKHRLKKEQLTDCYYEAGDVNQDGQVDIKDILILNKYRLGKKSEL